KKKKRNAPNDAFDNSSDTNVASPEWSMSSDSSGSPRQLLLALDEYNKYLKSTKQQRIDIWRFDQNDRDVLIRGLMPRIRLQEYLFQQLYFAGDTTLLQMDFPNDHNTFQEQLLRQNKNVWKTVIHTWVAGVIRNNLSRTQFQNRLANSAQETTDGFSINLVHICCDILMAMRAADDLSRIDPYYFVFPQYNRLQLSGETRLGTSYREIAVTWSNDITLEREWMMFRKDNDIRNVVTDTVDSAHSRQHSVQNLSRRNSIDEVPLLPNGKEYALHFLQLTYPYHYKIICDRCRKSKTPCIQCSRCGDFDLCEDCEEIVHLESVGMPSSLIQRYMQYQKQQKPGNKVVPPHIRINCCYNQCPFQQMTTKQVIQHIKEIHFDDPRVVLCPICEANGIQQKNLVTQPE
ncbi:hypothetical protein RFI_23381, partial [Reticulomyxa filosa]